MPKIAIIGGGPAGLATAISLSGFQLSVTLFEAGYRDEKVVGEHLAAEAIHEFNKMKIPMNILEENSIPCTEIQNGWGGKELHYNESIMNPFGHGYILSRPDFDIALLQHCKKVGVEVKENCRVSRVVKRDKKWEIYNASDKFEVDFVIDASGRHSKFKLDSTIIHEGEDELIGITKRLTPLNDEKTQMSFLLLEPGADGWWYSVQLQSGIAIVTFMTDAKMLSLYQSSADSFWKWQFARSNYTKSRFKHFDLQTENIFIQSAKSKITKPISGDHWLCVGDAAASYDPLSSAGILKGLKMGQAAANAVQKYINGDEDSLKDYEKEVLGQFDEYLDKKRDYYLQETRWMDQPFWYRRNLNVKSIKHFTIHPLDNLKLTDEISEAKVKFLQNQLPEFDFDMLLKCAAQNSTAKEIVTAYQTMSISKRLNPYFMHALEGMKIIGLMH